MNVDIDTLIPCASVPDLLRKGAPVYDLVSEQTVTFVSASDVEAGREPQAIVGPLRGKLVSRKIGFLYLDLNDPTGRAIALDWLRQRSRNLDDRASAREIKRFVMEMSRRRR